MQFGTRVLCRHDASRDHKYTDAGQLMRMAFSGFIGTVESEHVDEVHGTCYGIRFGARRIGHSCAFYDREELMTHVHTPSDKRIFVFGSNLLGIHGAGGAYYAHRELLFPWGISEGIPSSSGRAYAIPTCRAPGIPLPMSEVRGAVARFIRRARLFESEIPDVRFFVSEVGCGFAGFTAAEIAPLFAEAPANCDLPPMFLSILGEKSNRTP